MEGMSMLSDEQLEKKLKRLKHAYEQQPQITNSQQLLLAIQKQRNNQVKRKRRFVPAFVALSVCAIVALLSVTTPQLMQTEQEATRSNEGNNEMAGKENDHYDVLKINRPDQKQETIDIEGMPEDVTFTLIQHNQLRLSTYYPPNLVVEEGDNKLVFFIDENSSEERLAYIEIYGINREELSSDQSEELLKPYADYTATLKEKSEHLIPFSESEYEINKGTDLVGTVSIFEKNERIYRITVHYPIEYGDGFVPRAEKIISELQFHE